jgi:hypothetical protein
MCAGVEEDPVAVGFHQCGKSPFAVARGVGQHRGENSHVEARDVGSGRSYGGCRKKQENGSEQAHGCRILHWLMREPVSKKRHVKAQQERTLAARDRSAATNRNGQ